MVDNGLLRLHTYEILLYTSGFLDDVMLWHSGRYGALRIYHSGESVTAETIPSIPTEIFLNDKDEQVHVMAWVAHRGRSLLSTISLFSLQ